MIAARIARRLVRKLVKPLALWWAGARVKQAEAEAAEYMAMRAELIGIELSARKRAVVLAQRRNEIARW